MDVNWMWIVSQIILLIATLYLAFFKSYFSEKGKRLAYKEDIDQVTNAVEAIRDRFTREQEILKAQLQRSTSYSISYREEEKKAIIEYHSILSQWLFTILEVKYNSVGWSAIEYIANCRADIDGFYAKTGVARAKVELLVEDQRLVGLAHQLYSEAINFNGWTGKEFLSLQLNMERQKSVSTKFLEMMDKAEQDYLQMKSLADDEEAIEAERTKLVENYHLNRQAEFVKVKLVEEKFIDMVKSYLKR